MIDAPTTQSDRGLLTIAIPTYNRHRALSKSIEYIRKNFIPSIKSVNILIVDNGSTDGTKEYLKQIDECSDWLDVVASPANLGFRSQIFRIIRSAQTKYVMLMSDEDAPIASGLNTMLEFIQEKDYDLIVPRYEGDNPQGVSKIRELHAYEFRTIASYISGITFKVSSSQSVLTNYANYILHEDNPYPHSLICLFLMIFGRTTSFDQVVASQLNAETPMAELGLSTEKRNQYWTPNSRFVQAEFFITFLSELSKEIGNPRQLNEINGAKDWIESTIVPLLRLSARTVGGVVADSFDRSLLQAAIQIASNKNFVNNQGKKLVFRWE
jgi:glycosyltransferase involved in cell wall biosynthesis